MGIEKKEKSRIYLTQPAEKWDDGFPLGNGRLGMMPFGRPDEEQIIINEETVWYGGENKKCNPDMREQIPRIRELLAEGKVSEAEFLAKMAMTSTPKYNNPYQPAADMRICLLDHKYPVEAYGRTLDLETAVASIDYKMNGVGYHRELFVSHAYQVGVIHMWADAPFCVQANLNRRPFEQNTGKLDDVTAACYGQNGVGGVQYCSAVRICKEGERGSVGTMGDYVFARDVTEVTMYVACQTDFARRLEKAGETEQGWESAIRLEALARLSQAEAVGYRAVKETHVREYGRLFSRMGIQLGAKDPGIATDRMLDDLRQKRMTYRDYLVQVLFDYARYLEIGSSYDCALPSNLQGIWNGSYVPSWLSQFTININTEMNYWMTDACGLGECYEPLFQFVDRLVERGRKTAREAYGCRGFCAHHNTNLWANTDVDGILNSSPFWPMGGAWMSLALYDHYTYHPDLTFLKQRVLPVLRESVLFFYDYLYRAEDGSWVTGPSLSPENTYVSKTGEKGAVCMAPTMDSMILRQLLRAYLEGSKTAGERDCLETGECVQEMAEEILTHLPPIALTKDGRIREWQEDYPEVELGHRHISHLYGLYPGHEITEEQTELFEAARKTLETRLAHGGGHTGWSKSWILCFYARLKDGNTFLKNLTELLQVSIQDNMLDSHPPFQIDGNFGSAAAITEALLQSRNGWVDVLPALPDEWKAGWARGMGLRGGLKADLEWKDGKLSRLWVTAERDGNWVFIYGKKRRTVDLKEGERREIFFI